MKSAIAGTAASLSQYPYWLGCALSLLHAAPVCVVGAEAEGPVSFEPFQIIAQRNIFSPMSSGRPVESGKPSEPKLDSLVLAGTMSYEKGQFAFFDGSNPDFRKVLRVGDNIGGCVLTEITFKQVSLKSGELEFELPAGTRLIRENAGQWKPGGRAEGISPPVETASQRVQARDSKPSGKPPKEGKAFEPDPDKYDRWAEKKISKYLAGIDPEIKKEKHGSKTPGAFFEAAPKKPEKRHKHDEG
jgi:hypothetical protein